MRGGDPTIPGLLGNGMIDGATGFASDLMKSRSTGKRPRHPFASKRLDITHCITQQKDSVHSNAVGRSCKVRRRLPGKSI